ncbi:hypothetical protein [Furfurilactobacillus siliginis]|uniref:Uncharacterized protein n=1 Tax=Furfurilactobacillus siliginis TaxID=348151 RepID=A0A0R2L2Y1_9LACO|nr:hypothetical protein [Furfurilactobacillus siliginis]KRN93594.1 hypothetical protein IV55_GL001013 [Furfurilactobacillus siliginis]GEK29250.1 hypothetical protein LSI01_15610 [Furfurilactobacillus siliginis]
MKQVAGTILSIDDGTPSFLVTVDQATGKYGFFNTTVSEDKTALASVLDELHNDLAIDLESLRLSELTTCELDAENISLFVFDHVQVDASLESKASAHGLAFVQGNKLHELFHDVKFDAAPVFD